MSEQALLQALSHDGSAEMPVILPYEMIYVRDHADALFTVPWWYEHETDISRQMEYIRQYMTAVNHDLYFPKPCYTDEYRARHFLQPGQTEALLCDTRRINQATRVWRSRGWAAIR